MSAPHRSARPFGRALSLLNGALVPLLRTEVLSRREGALQGLHPRDAPIGHAPGHDPDRVLIVGSGPAFGWGVTTHDLSLAGALARAISGATGRGCDIELLATPGITAAEALGLLAPRRLDRYDAVVFVLGMNDAIRGTRSASWQSSISHLRDHVLSSTTATTDVFFVGIQPVRSVPLYDTFFGGVAARHGESLNQITAQLCAASARASFLPLPGQDPTLAEPSRHRTPAQYRAWAAALAPSIAQRLDARSPLSGDRRHRQYQIDELVRQLAVDGLPLVDLADNPTLKRLVELAHRAFRVQTAIFSIMDGQRQIHLIQAGSELSEVPRDRTFGDIALQASEPLVVRDARSDERFRDHPLVTGPPHLRFYAGIPISGPGGERVGMLCITDDQPRRRSDDIDLPYLRELSVLAERELWTVLNSSAA